jgi:hypothetical protein
MIITDRFDEEIVLTDGERKLLESVSTLFREKDSDFRVAFVSAAMAGYCDLCGKGGEHPCFCTRDD